MDADSDNVSMAWIRLSDFLVRNLTLMLFRSAEGPAQPAEQDAAQNRRKSKTTIRNH